MKTSFFFLRTQKELEKKKLTLTRRKSHYTELDARVKEEIDEGATLYRDSTERI